MDNLVRLAFVPGCPITMDAFYPKSELYLLQSRLFGEGIPCDIADFGVLDAAHSGIGVTDDTDDVVVPGWMEQDSQRWGGLPMVFQFKHSRTDLAQQAWMQKCLDTLCHGAPRNIAFWIERRGEFRQVRRLSQLLKQQAPETRLILMGPYACHYGAWVLADCPALDVVIGGSVLESLLALVEGMEGEVAPRKIPGLVYRDAQGAVQKNDVARGSSGAMPLKYGPFPKQEAALQFALFPLRFSCQPVDFQFQMQNRNYLEAKNPKTLMDEVKFLQRYYNARVFHIASPYVCPDELAAFADLLLMQNVVAIYSLGDLTDSISAVLAERLFASGCRVIGFRVPTGSQRLLEDFYGCEVSTSAIRASLRHCRKAGIFTTVRLTYPCTLDDYHTRAETELLVESGKPDAVCIETPFIVPDSLWHKRASEFGFFINHKDYQRFVIGEKSAYGSLPYTMRGWNSRRMHQAQASLAASLIKAGAMINVQEQVALLARLVRSTDDEQLFIEEVRTALQQHNIRDLGKLAEHVNATARTLHSGTLDVAGFTEKAASFS